MRRDRRVIARYWIPRSLPLPLAECIDLLLQLKQAHFASERHLMESSCLVRRHAVPSQTVRNCVIRGLARGGHVIPGTNCLKIIAERLQSAMSALGLRSPTFNVPTATAADNCPASRALAYRLVEAGVHGIMMS